MDRDELQRIAWRLEQAGATAIAGLERDLAAVAAAARRAGVHPVATAVLADPSAPDVARVRAFALVATALDVAPPDRLAAA